MVRFKDKKGSRITNDFQKKIKKKIDESNCKPNKTWIKT